MRPNPLLFCLPALMVCAAACRPTFDVTVTGQSTIPASSLPFVGNIIPVSFPALTSFDLSNTQDFKNQGVPVSALASVKLKSMTMSVSSPPGANFNFVNSIEFDVSAQGQPDAAVASLNPVPQGQSQLSLGVDGVELLPYVAASSMSVTTNASGNPPPQDTTVNATLVFECVPKIP